MALIGLFNAVERDRLMYERRDWGINLKWYKDAGKHDKWGDLKDLAEKVRRYKEDIGEWIGWTKVRRSGSLTMIWACGTHRRWAIE